MLQASWVTPDCLKQSVPEGFGPSGDIISMSFNFKKVKAIYRR